MYQVPPFTENIIPPTTAGDIFYPAKGTPEMPALPMVVYPQMIGAEQAFSGPTSLKICCFRTGGGELPPILLGHIHTVDSCGNTKKVFSLYGGGAEDFRLDVADAYVLEKVDTSPFEVGFDLKGYSSQQNHAE